MFTSFFSLPLFLEAEPLLRSAGETTFYRIASAVLIVLVLVGLNRMSSVEKSLSGNRLGAISMLLAVVLTLWYYNIFNIWQIWVALLIGTLIGSYLCRKVDMIQMPQMVGLLNGFGGLASMLAGILTLAGSNINPAGNVNNPAFSSITAGLAIVVGGLTWTGSAIAAAKLHRIIDQKPKVLPGHQLWTGLTLLISLISAILFAFPPFNQAGSARALLIILAVIAGNAFGYFLAIRVGGADMPITISLLNSFSGVAGAIAGMAISDVLLVAIGGIVGASGLILTQIMCRSMNRKLADILLGKTSSQPKATAAKVEKAPAATSPASKQEAAKEATPAKSVPSDPSEAAAAKLMDAESVIIVPGYGMALSQAQPLVKQLTQILEDAGKKVSFAIHPVAGRMPGHMNVLLAEVDIPYDQLYEMDAINGEFAHTDCVVVIGANDVLNPAANTAEGTPIYGMPVLDVAAAKHIILCNFDLKPGYAGVPNPLYEEAETDNDHVQLYLGDAKETLQAILKAFREGKKAEKASAPAPSEGEAKATPEVAKGPSTAAKLLRQAKNVIIVPGYGMALSQAQPLVKQLMDHLETEGADVEFAIHPVAGRMPGHMNVLLAEVDIPYDKLHEMSDINDKFKESDAVLVIGANDVINPAANTAEGTPIYGMPVLQVADAAHVIICNFDLKPGYAGVENPLYEEAAGADDRVILLLGDAKETLKAVMEEL